MMQEKKQAAARIIVKNNQQMLEIDGKIYPPEFINPITYPLDVIKAWGEAGLKVVTVECNTRSRKPEDFPRPFGAEETKERLAELFSCIPDAYVILRVNLSPSAEWVHDHPEELVKYSDGSCGPVYNILAGPGKLEGHYSLCSQAWMRDEAEILKDFLADLETSPYFHRIIGVFLGGGGTWEWYYLPSNKPEEVYGDFSEPFRSYYSAFLREKYGTEENLRKIWRRPDVSFDAPPIPTLEERKVINQAHREMSFFRTNWNQAKKIDILLEENPKAETTKGLFLNAEDYAHVADYYEAWHKGVANTINYFARTVKNLYPSFICGVFYSNIGCTNYWDAAHTTGVYELFDKGLIDFLAAPGTYDNREPGGHTCSRLVYDSMTIRGVACINENDTRTHLTKPFQRAFMGVYTPEDSLRNIKRDFARDICDCVNGYWYDLTWEESWFSDPQIIALFKRQQEIARASFQAGAGKHHEIAVLMDLESTHHIARVMSQMVLDYYRATDLAHLGAPVDYYYHNDMADPRMPDYKMYIMLNGYCLSDAERDAIHQKAGRNHALVLWLYAPGYINYDSDRRMSSENIEKTVGMHVDQENEILTADFRADPSHPAMRYASARRFYGRIDRDIHSNVWYDKDMEKVSYLNPVFYIREEAGVEILGRYCLNGKPAMAMTSYKGFCSVYCAAAVARSEIVASLAKWAGCHLYSRDDDVLYANDHFVTIHAKDDGKRTIHFPAPCSPFEVYERVYYGRNITELTVDMQLGDTKMWSVCEELSRLLETDSLP